MKNKTSLVLMEQLVMVLAFALAAALCLGIFAKANQTSRQTQFRDDAVLLVQNAAEVLKSCAGDLEKAAKALDGTYTENEIHVESEGYSMVITPVGSDTPGLGQAEICVSMDNVLIFTLRTGWQEVGK